MSSGLLPHEMKRRAAAWCAAFGNPLVTPADKAALLARPCASQAVGLDVSSLNLPPVVTPPAVFSGRAVRAGGPQPGEVQVVSYEWARRWAVAQGLCRPRGAMDLRRVNQVRRGMWLAPFALKGT